MSEGTFTYVAFHAYFIYIYIYVNSGGHGPPAHLHSLTSHDLFGSLTHSVII